MMLVKIFESNANIIIHFATYDSKASCSNYRKAGHVYYEPSHPGMCDKLVSRSLLPFLRFHQLFSCVQICFIEC
jgi:hypothetical protein